MLKFEWDDVKNMANIQKHGVSFRRASKVFADINMVELPEYYRNGELRYDVLGMVDRVLFVVCTDRSEDTIRIISARPATKNEEAIYYGESNYDA